MYCSFENVLTVDDTNQTLLYCVIKIVVENKRFNYRIMAVIVVHKKFFCDFFWCWKQTCPPTLLNTCENSFAESQFTCFLFWLRPCPHCSAQVTPVWAEHRGTSGV